MKGKVLDDEIFSDKIQDVIDKIKAIALVHEKLYETESLSDVDFKSYILDIVRHLLISHSATNSLKTEFDVDDIILPIEKAVPCGILINEIITIILKYVFPAPKEGFIHISLKKTESDRCLLLIEDNGDKTDLNYQHPDHLFGMQLIHILSEQLKGNLKIHSSTSGTKYSLLLDI